MKTLYASLRPWFICLFLFFLSLLPLHAQISASNEWTWWAGAKDTATGTNYGILGVGSPTNTPGSRYSPVTWTDTHGNFWLFGGDSGGQTNEAKAPHVYGDLWKLNVASQQWTWMSGSMLLDSSGVYGSLGQSASANAPGARNAATAWSDNAGNLWLFGGYGVDAAGVFGMLNDLWKFNPVTNQWTWMGGGSTFGINCFSFDITEQNCAQPGVYGTLGAAGANNIPKGRNQAAAWTDPQGSFWMSGGWGFDIENAVQYYYNDVWKFNPTTNQWTWMAGISDGAGSSCFRNLNLYYWSCGEPGISGSMHRPDASSLPGGRRGASVWTDQNGLIWLFGGQGFDVNGLMGSLNDLWTLNTTTNIWTWVGGSNTAVGTFVGQAAAVWGEFGVPNSANIPSGRSNSLTWRDNAGTFWLYGGDSEGFEDTTNPGTDNDLWKFEPSTNRWAWMGGGGLSPFPVYGLQGVPQPVVTPGARKNGASWTDEQGNLWLFGGDSFPGWLGDLWEYRQAVDPLPPAAPPTFSLNAGAASSGQLVIINDQTPEATIYYTLDGSTPTTSSNVYSGPIPLDESLTLEAIAAAWNFGPSSVASAAYHLPATGTSPTNTAVASSLTPSALGQAVLLTATVSSASGGIPTGSVHFSVGSLPLGTATLIGGSATLTASSIPQGENLVTAVYGGDSVFSGSSAKSLTQVVTASLPGRGEWTWVSGPSTINQPGAYGKMGTAAPGNTPGNRQQSATWIDGSGHLWLFGGSASNVGATNDLWVFDPTMNLWTWKNGSSTTANSCNSEATYCGVPGVYGVKGVFTAQNQPGGRATTMRWTDTSGHFWLFGGYGYDSRNNLGVLNDLWEYDPSINQWAWISGSATIASDGLYLGQPGIYGQLGGFSPANSPGGRMDGATWSDAKGNLWLFGGDTLDSRGLEYLPLNDLWEFNLTTSQWSWQGGSSHPADSTAEVGIYGQLGTPSPANRPGGRAGASAWTDANGDAWLFGGIGFNSVENYGDLNDLWEFDPVRKEWTWMGGSNVGSSNGFPPVYGSAGVPAAANTPGGRNAALSWTDSRGRLWLFGGESATTLNKTVYFNDLWLFDPGTLRWTWINGSSDANCGQPLGGSCNQPGTYGAIGVPAPANVPSSRDLSAGWADKSGNLWLFGGQANSLNELKLLSDLWRYLPSVDVTVSPSAAAPPTFNPVAGTYTSVQSVTLTDATPRATIFYTTDGRTTPTANSTAYTGPIPVSASETIQAIAQAPGLASSVVASASYVIQLPRTATPVLSLSTGTYSSTQSLTITDATPEAAIFYTLDGSTPTAGSNLYSGPLIVSLSETVQAIAVASAFSPSAIASGVYRISPSPGDFTLSATLASLTIPHGSSAKTTISLTPSNGFSSAVSLTCTGLPIGASCQFAPQSIIPAGAVASTTLTLSTSPSSAALQRRSKSLLSCTALMAALCWLAGPRRRSSRTIVCLFAAMVGLGLLSGCGSSGLSTYLPTNTTITVVGTSGQLQHQISIILTTQ